MYHMASDAQVIEISDLAEDIRGITVEEESGTKSMPSVNFGGVLNC